jgi:hypothetical protein
MGLNIFIAFVVVPIESNLTTTISNNDGLWHPYFSYNATLSLVICMHLISCINFNENSRLKLMHWQS